MVLPMGQQYQKLKQKQKQQKKLHLQRKLAHFQLEHLKVIGDRLLSSLYFEPFSGNRKIGT